MQAARLDAFQVIADPSRRHMLHLLSKDSKHVTTVKRLIKKGVEVMA